MQNSELELQEDIHQIGAIPFIAPLLDLVCSVTGMGFAAVARVTDERWIAGSVRDQIQFGLAAGGELPVASTICHEIRQSHQPVVINRVSEDAIFCHHHTPATYGFESYISYPIIQRKGGFFGTLCAIDPRAARLNTPSITALFKTLAALIAAYLDETPAMTDPEKQIWSERIEARLGTSLEKMRAEGVGNADVLLQETDSLQRVTNELCQNA